MIFKRFIFLFILIIFTGNAMAENANEKLLIELTHGDVVIELHNDIAPLHVDR
ncbi:MAG: peptidylprolyl isomerase, partial [Alphaproteobacteria bacterium]|nr:peptidylprolyl isomerase [Alphaproteobacteria bacterium]